MSCSLCSRPLSKPPSLQHSRTQYRSTHLWPKSWKPNNPGGSATTKAHSRKPEKIPRRRHLNPLRSSRSISFLPCLSESMGDRSPARPSSTTCWLSCQYSSLCYSELNRTHTLSHSLAYSYTLRTFALSSFASLPATSSERMPATQLVAQLVPFLVERSNTALNSLEDAVEYVASRQPSIVSL